MRVAIKTFRHARMVFLLPGRVQKSRLEHAHLRFSLSLCDFLLTFILISFLHVYIRVQSARVPKYSSGCRIPSSVTSGSKKRRKRDVFPTPVSPNKAILISRCCWPVQDIIFRRIRGVCTFNACVMQNGVVVVVECVHRLQGRNARKRRRRMRSN